LQLFNSLAQPPRDYAPSALFEDGAAARKASKQRVDEEVSLAELDLLAEQNLASSDPRTARSSIYSEAPPVAHESEAPSLAVDSLFGDEAAEQRRSGFILSALVLVRTALELFEPKRLERVEPSFARVALASVPKIDWRFDFHGAPFFPNLRCARQDFDVCRSHSSRRRASSLAAVVLASSSKAEPGAAEPTIASQKEIAVMHESTKRLSHLAKPPLPVRWELFEQTSSLPVRFEYALPDLAPTIASAGTLSWEACLALANARGRYHRFIDGDGARSTSFRFERVTCSDSATVMPLAFVEQPLSSRVRARFERMSLPLRLSFLSSLVHHAARAHSSLEAVAWQNAEWDVEAGERVLNEAFNA
jgi:hypothetical protein